MKTLEQMQTETNRDKELKEGEVCIMCQGAGHELGLLNLKPCCWCLGKGIIPSRKERRLDSTLEG